MLRLKEAMQTAKDNGRGITNEELGAVVLPEKTPAGQRYYISQWRNGKDLSALKPEHIERICSALGVDANFLFNINV